MGRIVYVNDRYLEEDQAMVSVFDRGFLFADAVYEVTAVLDGKLVDFSGHMRRLTRSLEELDISVPYGADDLLAIHRQLIDRNRLVEGLVYLQITRGVADRDFHFPEKVEPTLVLFTQEKSLLGERAGLRVISVPESRWRRRDIKTVQLLAASMAKMTAKKAGKDDAWLVEDGLVTEGTSSNAYIVTAAGTIVTRDLTSAILPGITRAAVLKLAAESQLAVEERSFSIEEAQRAREAFISSATAFVTPVVEVDGIPVGEGRPGPLVRRLHQLYVEESRRTAI
jgi:D-alanine transaminase